MAPLAVASAMAAVIEGPNGKPFWPKIIYNIGITAGMFPQSVGYDQNASGLVHRIMAIKYFLTGSVGKGRCLLPGPRHFFTPLNCW